MRITKRITALLVCLLLLFACAQAEESRTQWVELGEGRNELTLVVVFPEGITKGYHIRSDHETLLEGLLALELIQLEETESGVVLTAVDGCPLPQDDPDAYWFISVFDVLVNSLVPCQLPLEQLPLAGQTYALGLISGIGANEVPAAPALDPAGA